MYPCKKGTPIWILGKIFFYISLTTLTVLYIHSSMIKNNYEELYTDKSVDKFIDRMQSPSIFRDDFKPVMPKLEGGIYEDFTGTKHESVDGILSKLGV